MRLAPLPDSFVQTRGFLHQIAFFAVAPARYHAVGRMGLRPAPGGFGTPEFNGAIARVEGDTLVFETGGNVATQGISTVGEAARFFGHEYEVEWFDDFHDPLPPVDPDMQLTVDDVAARSLGQWFHFGFTVLAELRRRSGPDLDASEVQLWPEHFDPAIELGSVEAGKRASYGASPGDADHVDPYLYVAPWGDVDGSVPFWNDDSFGGSSLGYSELVGAGDAVEKAVGFLLEGYRILQAG